MTESIDLVFVSNSIDLSLWEMTRNAIRTGMQNAGMEVGTIVTIEQNRYIIKQPTGKTIHYDFPFNYNKCLNLGKFVCNNSSHLHSSKRKSKSKYIAFCNNDLYFESNWARNAVRAMKEYGYLSVSPTSKHIFSGVIEGYTIGRQLLGWCIIVDTCIFDKIGKFDESVNFWYSDDVYAHQLRKAGIKHALVGNSRVIHLLSRTMKKLKPKQRIRYMSRQKYKQFKESINLRIKTN